MFLRERKYLVSPEHHFHGVLPSRVVPREKDVMDRCGHHVVLSQSYHACCRCASLETGGMGLRMKGCRMCDKRSGQQDQPRVQCGTLRGVLGKHVC